MKDLWPKDLIDQVVESPLGLLKAQASLLGSKTRNMVTAEIHRSASDSSDSFEYGFFLVAPALSNYSFQLFRVTFKIDFYPVLFFPENEIREELRLKQGTPRDRVLRIEAENEERFIYILELILKSKRATQVIRALLAQSVALAPIAYEDDDLPF